MKKGETREQFIERMAQPNPKEINDNINFDDIPKIEELGPLIKRKKKQPTTLRLDTEIIDFFKQNGPGYQTKINDFLLAYVKSQKEEELTISDIEISIPELALIEMAKVFISYPEIIAKARLMSKAVNAIAKKSEAI